MHILKSFNVKSSTYFHMKTKILADFQICVSVPLNQIINRISLEHLANILHDSVFWLRR